VNINEIRDRSTSGSFPVEALKGADTACLLFCAAFHGSNDAIFVHDAGIKRALLIDNDYRKLTEMEAAWCSYQPNWDFQTGDAFGFLQRAAERFDVVVADPWTGHISRALKMLNVWHRYVDRALIVGVTMIFLAEQGLPPTLDGFNRWLQFTFPNLPPASDLHKRSDYRGGVYWAVIPGKDHTPDA